jgi:hypothetical protein
VGSLPAKADGEKGLQVLLKNKEKSKLSKEVLLKRDEIKQILEKMKND